MDNDLKIYSDLSARNSGKQEDVYIEFDRDGKHFKLVGTPVININPTNTKLNINILNINNPSDKNPPRLDIEYYNSKTVYLIVDPLTKAGRRKVLQELGLSDESKLKDNEEINDLNKNIEGNIAE